jgi:hypothetical protein
MLILAAVAIAVAAFALLRPEDEDSAGERPAATAPEPTAPEPEPAGEETETGPERPRRPRAPTIRVRGGQPVGGVREIRGERGERVRFSVESDQPYEVHLHGYDVFERAAPGAPARFSFEAELEGIFEVELEGPHVQVATVRVEP